MLFRVLFRVLFRLVLASLSLFRLLLFRLLLAQIVVSQIVVGWCVQGDLLFKESEAEDCFRGFEGSRLAVLFLSVGGHFAHLSNDTT